ncbi:hypothetical protein Scep_022997 [Stephania cephalantha]|uniref:FBD domain-containing protein n=1 Tax=Stephania cephalantha TaxID=152367 RepID=A0AAP0HYB1_9MAGN
MTITLGNLFKSYDNIRSLELCANFERPVHVARFASVLMSNCSCIEILVLKVVDHPKSEYQNYIKVPELPLSCTLSKLEYIGVQVEGLDCELELFRFLLCSAVNLLRMTIAWKYSEHKIGDLKLFHRKISLEYPKVHFLFQFF